MKAKKRFICAYFMCISIVVIFSMEVGATRWLDKKDLEVEIENYKKLILLEPANTNYWFNLGVAYHDICSVHDVNCSTDAVAALEKSNTIKKDPVTLAYLGSSWTLVGRDAKNPIKKIDGVLKGLDFLDEAVQMDPTNVVARRIRYENNMSLPDIFGRKKIAEQDLDWLLKLYSQDKNAFNNYYDPAHVFYFKAKLLASNNDWKSANTYALVANSIVRDLNLAAEIKEFLKEK